MAYASISFVYGETPSASKWNILGTNDASFNDGTGIAVSAITPEKLLSGNGTSWAYQSYTPTYTNFTLGNGTVSSYYVRVGKMIHYRGKIVLGSTSTMGTGPTISFPVTTSSNHTADTPMGTVWLLDTSAGTRYPATAVWSSTTAMFFAFYNHSSGTYSFWGVSAATVPFTWATGDIISWDVTYEAA